MAAAILAGIIAVLATAAAICLVISIVHARGAGFVTRGGRSVSSIRTLGRESSVTNAAGAEAHMGDGKAAQAGGDLERRYRGFGIFAGVVIAALAAKSFVLQVIRSEEYVQASEDNQYATVTLPAPRGTISDRSGTVLVTNRSCLTVLADSDVADDYDVMCRLSAVLGIPRNVLRQRVLDSTVDAQAQRVVASDVKQRDVAFISEHSDAFSGVSVETRNVRDYPYGALAAHVLGYTGTASTEEIATQDEDRDIISGDDVGKSGVEEWYDGVLSGNHGIKTVITDASGNVLNVVSETQATKGNDIYLTIDAQLQYKADYTLQNLIAPEGNAIGSGKGTSGAIVVMDVRDGSILCLSSFPTYEPGNFVGGITEEIWNVYNSSEAMNPLMNRAIAGAYPAASTFKAFTGLAGLKYGYAKKTDQTWQCDGEWDGWETGDVQKCWLKGGHGKVDFTQGIVQSCDVVFYEIAKQFFDNRGEIGYTALQDEVKKYGFGSETGIDLSGEAYGRIPTPEWKLEYFNDVPEESSWKGGDLTNMIIGQGYVLITPIQLAVAYGGLATGKLMKPHVLQDVRNAEGEVVTEFKSEVVAEPDVIEEDLTAVRAALHKLATEGDVAYLFTALGLDAAAKTGTGEVTTKGDYAWSVCYAPFSDPHYVSVCLIEEGGGGAKVAMPIASQMLADALAVEAGTFDFGVGTVKGSIGAVVEYNFVSEGRED